MKLRTFLLQQGGVCNSYYILLDTHLTLSNKIIIIVIIIIIIINYVCTVSGPGLPKVTEFSILPLSVL